MIGQRTLLAVLLGDRGLERYGTFRAAYEKAARSLDRELAASAPSRAQFHRWLTGDLRNLPYTDHCRVLEHMLSGYSAKQLFGPCQDQAIPAPIRTGAIPGPSAPSGQSTAPPTSPGMAGIAAAFTSRSEFAAKIEPCALLEDAGHIRAAGLSLNLICQQVPDQRLKSWLTHGTSLTCLFLDPAGEAIQAREKEEDHPAGHLSALTRLNIDVMSRLRDRLPPDAQEHFHLAIYDETIRFNMILVDTHTCVVQPYLPMARGIDSPTLLIRNDQGPNGLYPVFEQAYEAVAERSRPL